MESLKFDSITKYFPGVKALDRVSFDIKQGECHALVGENGAGKSTLGKILAGIYQQDEGNILIDGEKVFFANPYEAKKCGISMVHQELVSCSNLSIAENLFLGSLPNKIGFLDKHNLEKKSKLLLKDMGLEELDVWQNVDKLSIAHMQMVQVAGAVGSGANIIIMDEPTSSISRKETDKLFELLRELKTRGVTVIYISHRLEEIFQITDRISVLRDGKYIGTIKTTETNKDEIIKMMVGRSIELYSSADYKTTVREEILGVKDLSVPRKFENINFTLHKGEILGLAGLVGAGRSEIACAIFGLYPNLVTGEIFVKGKKVKINSPVEAISHGIGLVPEDRKLQGLILSMTSGENLSLVSLPKLHRLGFIKNFLEEKLIDEYLNKLSVKPSNPNVNVSTFSGGNQQKIVLAKWLARDCEVLIIDEPTRGIDVKTKTEIHSLINQLAEQGKAILLISSELPELINLSTRILVIREGKIQGEFTQGQANQENLMFLMAGIKGGDNDIKH